MDTNGPTPDLSAPPPGAPRPGDRAATGRFVEIDDSHEKGAEGVGKRQVDTHSHYKKGGPRKIPGRRIGPPFLLKVPDQEHRTQEDGIAEQGPSAKSLGFPHHNPSMAGKNPG
jgi:hypothetical protein